MDGRPYLIQLALYWLAEREGVLADLLADAHTQSGIYSDHLRRHWEIIQRQPQLREAFFYVIVSSVQGADIDTLLAYQLERMGLVRLSGNAAIVSSTLYYKYFQSLLV